MVECLWGFYWFCCHCRFFSLGSSGFCEVSSESLYDCLQWLYCSHVVLPQTLSPVGHLNNTNTGESLRISSSVRYSSSPHRFITADDSLRFISSMWTLCVRPTVTMEMLFVLCETGTATHWSPAWSQNITTLLEALTLLSAPKLHGIPLINVLDSCSSGFMFILYSPHTDRTIKSRIRSRIRWKHMSSVSVHFLFELFSVWGLTELNSLNESGPHPQLSQKWT